MKTYKHFRVVFALIFLSMVCVSFFSNTAKALYCDPGGMGRAGCIGFFTGYDATATSCHNGGTDVINVLSGGIHSNNATDFINDIKGYLNANNGNKNNTQDNRGAAFIVHAVLGKHKTASYDPYVQWARDNFSDFEDRVRAYARGGSNYGIRWNVSRTTGVNSAYFNSCGNDDAFHSTEYGGATSDDIEFYWSGGALQIERACGNLRGDDKPIDVVKKWTIDPNASNNNAHPRPTNQVTWTLNATNSGPDSTDETVNLKVFSKLNGGGWTNTHDGNVGAGWAKDAVHPSGSWNPTWTLAQGDDGDTVCKFIRAQDKAWNLDGQYIDSGQSCSTAWQRWQIGATTAISAQAAPGPKVGDTITWTHTLTNKTGNFDYTSGTVTPTINYSSGANAFSVTPTNSPALAGIAKNWANGTDHTYTSTYVVKTTDAGKNLCESITASPYQRLNWGDASAGNGSTTTAASCRQVPYNYTLTPNVTTPDSFPEVGQDVTFTPSITNNAIPNATQSEPVAWEFHRLIFDPGVTPNTSLSYNANPACTFYTGYRVGECKLRGSGSKVVDANTTFTLPQDVYNVEKLAPGTKICYALSIKPYKHLLGQAADPNWAHQMICMIVSKKPKVQVIDGDLKVHSKIPGDLTRSIVTSTSNITDGGQRKTFGSWVDYGIFSQGTNSVAASGGGLTGGYPENPVNSSHWSDLTFANASGSLGNFTMNPYSSLASYFAGITKTEDGGASVGLPKTGTKVIYLNTDATVHMSDISIAKGGTFIVQAPNNTVTIDGDIKYDTGETLTKMGDIPQVVIVAKNITIKNSVTRVDAWLLATTSISTCSEAPDPLTAGFVAGLCDNPLQVYGPVSTPAIHLQRTAGASATNPEQAAETFRFSPSTYLWLRNFAQQNNNLTTTYATERPPRF